MLTATARNKRVTRTYTAAGNVATDLQDGSAQVTVTQAYAYDRAGRRIWHRIGLANDLVSGTACRTGTIRSLATWRRSPYGGASASRRIPR